MLSLSTSNKVTFNVNVSGTASTPTVRCLVGEHPAMSFPATKLANGEFEVIIDLPAGTRTGAHPFKVEVLLNGRLFTPINYSIDVTGDEELNPTPAPIDTAPATVAAAAPVASKPEPAPMIAKITEPEPGPDIPVPEQHDAKPVALDPAITKALWQLYDPMDMAFPDRGSEVEKLKYLQMLADRKPKKELGGLEKLTKAPVAKLKPREVVKPAAAPAKKISMLDIANEAEKKNKPAVKPAVKAAVKAAPKPAIKPAVKQVQEAHAPALTVSLTKGTVIYK